MISEVHYIYMCIHVVCIYIYTCCGTYLICLNCNLWYMYSQQMMQSQYQFSFLLPPPPAITSDLAAYVVPFWWTPFSVGFTYLNKKNSEFVLWCSIKTIYVSQNVCSFALGAVCPAEFLFILGQFTLDSIHLRCCLF